MRFLSDAWPNYDRTSDLNRRASTFGAPHLRPPTRPVHFLGRNNVQCQQKTAFSGSDQVFPQTKVNVDLASLFTLEQRQPDWNILILYEARALANRVS